MLNSSKKSIQKSGEPFAEKVGSYACSAATAMLGAESLNLPWFTSLDVSICSEAIDRSPRAPLPADHRFIMASPALWLSPHPRLAGKRGVDSKS